MGYYDQDYDNRYKQKGNRGNVFIASLVGAILGAILVIIAIPTLSNFDVLPYTIQPNENLAEEANEEAPVTAAKTINVDIDTQITKAVDKAGEAVVGITNLQTASFWTDDTEAVEAGTGSGIIYKKKGNKAYVVTNHHVVEGASQLEVTLDDGTKVAARLLGSDVWTDLAVLEIDASHVNKIIEFGVSGKLRRGEPAIAIGNPLGPQFSGSVTQGIISGLERTIPVDINQDGVEDWQADVIQTDAAINPGNSGGALVNIDGQLIGINSMKIAQNAVEGIGLAIPIDYAKPIINDLERFGEVKRPYMGVELKSVAEIPAYYQQEALKLPKDVNYGVAIRRVEPNSPASLAGLKELDVIVEMDGVEINDVIDLRKHLYNKKRVGDQMTVKFYRDGNLKQLTLKLGGETM
ncbi:S1C family serine protease [Neobacillus sp. D3-1R]|uniref:S1C family serine protease n=1 Tax=Neobacillus sp. D3-1R TaxID=3445778 RepID=UPI003FA17538